MVKANLQMLTHNATLIVPNQTFSPAATLRSLNTERCTALYGKFVVKIRLVQYYYTVAKMTNRDCIVLLH